MKKYSMKNLIVLVSIFFLSISNASAHAVQVAWCLDPTGTNLRVYIEHWHAVPLTLTPTSTIDLTTSLNGGTPIVLINVLPTGLIDGVALGSLPVFPGSTINVIGTGTQANTHNNWGYWDVSLISLGIDCDNSNPTAIIDVTVSNAADVNFADGSGGTVTYPESALASFLLPDCPPPTVTSSSIILCEGATFTLGTATVADSYSWTGPNGYTSSLQNPSPIIASALTEGSYNLVVTTGSNESLPGTTTVTIDTPPTPVLTGNNSVCDGNDIIFSTTATATNYYWIAPSGDTIITAVNNLTISDGDIN
ncbi:MAG: hypothetical protein COA38_18640, partial [Fluviicola sp.]